MGRGGGGGWGWVLCAWVHVCMHVHQCFTVCSHLTPLKNPEDVTPTAHRPTSHLTPTLLSLTVFSPPHTKYCLATCMGLTSERHIQTQKHRSRHPDTVIAQSAAIVNQGHTSGSLHSSEVAQAAAEHNTLDILERGSSGAPLNFGQRRLIHSLRHRLVLNLNVRVSAFAYVW